MTYAAHRNEEKKKNKYEYLESSVFGHPHYSMHPAFSKNFHSGDRFRKAKDQAREKKMRFPIYLDYCGL